MVRFKAVRPHTLSLFKVLRDRKRLAQEWTDKYQQSNELLQFNRYHVMFLHIVLYMAIVLCLVESMAVRTDFQH